ncbi:U3 small nucleolar RNA-associated protein 6 homolog [Takifugu flavidus]|uniref:U3 small nucleolar RNA-associated protein 6-like protein n=1 Tax=Takifugu flavidus TaxID=433684 RepID=A0A5C6MXX4_9TELE|nr:U3 small nucleolar RNA-associated protein 6 homolog [Takifugu flavidus]XP_056890591.1 U3 small nucleolar RNA-associated protein 6 homolog [Takifugu flavidus]TWW59669.1 U3 small nucleolar RNA-associated protein 6 -like protein [Takifugu flavidus]
MAEIVQRRIEERIPELEQLERVGLFTRKEVKCIIKRVTALEYKLHRLILNKEDFTAYVQYEINILELIKKRRAHIHYQFKREEIEHPIIHRINSVFRRATNKWKDDVQLWLSHVAFCKKWATKSQISKVFSSMLAIHPDKPALWILAAKSEMEDRNSSESARHLFLRALRFHPNNQKVYQEYFRMELLHCEKLRKQKMELEKAEMDLGDYEFSPEILSAKLAAVVYKDAAEKIKEAKFVISLLYIAAIFDFTQDLQELILQDLQGNYTEDSFTWDFMAKRELDAPGAGEELQTVKGRASDINRREERCCQVYEEGLKTINTEPMWTCYLAFCLERLKRKTNVQELKEKRQARLLGVFRRAHDCSLLKEEYYKIWVQILLESGDHEGAASMARAATERYSQSLAAWSLCLQMSMQLESVDMSKLFQDALSHINPKESLRLWQMQVQWSEAKQQPDETETVFKRALLSAVPAVSMEMKEHYLDWSYSTGGYKKARKTFKSLQDNRPLSKAFFTTMIQVEKKQDTPKMNNLRGYYERALQEFGTYDDDLWLQYIQEELGPLGQPENCSKIHWRAIKFLEGESVERFISKYTLLQTGH